MKLYLLILLTGFYTSYLFSATGSFEGKVKKRKRKTQHALTAPNDSTLPSDIESDYESIGSDDDFVSIDPSDLVTESFSIPQGFVPQGRTFLQCLHLDPYTEFLQKLQRNEYHPETDRTRLHKKLTELATNNHPLLREYVQACTQNNIEITDRAVSKKVYQALCAAQYKLIKETQQQNIQFDVAQQQLQKKYDQDVAALEGEKAQQESKAIDLIRLFKSLRIKLHEGLPRTDPELKAGFDSDNDADAPYSDDIRMKALLNNSVSSQSQPQPHNHRQHALESIKTSTAVPF